MNKQTIFFILLLSLSFYFIQVWFSPTPQKTPTPVESSAIPVPLEKTIPTVSPSTLLQEEVKREEQEVQEEEFFVLENEYLQVVFTNKGGSIREINLPFRSNKNQKSVIHPIEFDQLLLQEAPQLSLFPANPYFTPNPTISLFGEKNEKGALGGYYPLLRRPLPSVPASFNPKFLSLNIINERNESEAPFFRLVRFEKNLIEWESTQLQRRIIKTFSFPENGAPYCLELKVRVEGDSKNLWLTSGIPEVELTSSNFEPTVKYLITRGDKSSVEKVDLPKTSLTITSLSPDWIVDSNGFLGIILDSYKENVSGFRIETLSGDACPSRLSLLDPLHNPYPSSKYPGYQVSLPLPSTSRTLHFRIFAGPFADNILKKVDQLYSDPTTGYNPSYISAQSFHGWFSFISEPFAKFLFFLMNFFHSFTHSWGISIILLTVALRIMLYPLNSWSIKSTARMQAISPQITAIQTKYKKDPKKAQVEIVKLYREKGVNPFTGCLPMLIQMPFLFGMFDLLKSTFDLRGATFIPGWIDNLTSPDVLFQWSYPIPFIGNQFHLLPILLGIAMYVQQKMTSNFSTKELTDQQKQQKVMGNIMALVFTVMFYNFPSGLNLYWLSSMLLGILQQWLSMKGLFKK